MPDFETLNAYVDGELDPGRAAEVARAVARDPGLADQVALLSRLRSAVRESIEVPEIAVPAMPPRTSASRTWMMAASIVFLFLGTALFMHRIYDQPIGDSWLNPIWRLHAAWAPPAPGVTSEPGLAPGEAAGEVLPAALDSTLAGAFVPDLTAAKLTVAYISGRHEVAGRETLLVGYTGTRGCKVTLLMMPAMAPLTDRPVRFDAAGATSYGWRAGGLDYLLAAEGMDAERFRLIADTVYRASLERLPVDSETRMALLESRRRSAPCAT